MTKEFIHNGHGECPLCGLTFFHSHPRKDKPKEFIAFGGVQEEALKKELPSPYHISDGKLNGKVLMTSSPQKKLLKEIDLAYRGILSEEQIASTKDWWMQILLSYKKHICDELEKQKSSVGDWNAALDVAKDIVMKS